MLLHFNKMNGAGNDFIVIDNRDGEAEMCGNGARCFGRYVANLGEQPVDTVSFETIAGTLTADMIGDNVRIAMSDPFDLDMNSDCNIDSLGAAVHVLNTGVPHAVSFVENLPELNVVENGAAVRYHDRFSPKGTNANFATVLSPDHIAIRTYERGVEGETLACGTGMCAAAMIHNLLTDAPSPIKVDVAGGDTLEIGFTRQADNTFTDVTLTGPADFVFEGKVEIK